MAKRPSGPSDTLQRVLAELEVIRLGQEHLSATLTRLTETWTGMFRQLGLQMELLATRIGDQHQSLAARVEALEHRIKALEARPEERPA